MPGVLARQAPHQLRTHAVRTEVPIKVPLYLHHKVSGTYPLFEDSL